MMPLTTVSFMLRSSLALSFPAQKRMDTTYLHWLQSLLHRFLHTNEEPRPHEALDYLTPLEYAQQNFFKVSPMWSAGTAGCNQAIICYNRVTMTNPTPIDISNKPD